MCLLSVVSMLFSGIGLLIVCIMNVGMYCSVILMMMLSVLRLRVMVGSSLVLCFLLICWNFLDVVIRVMLMICVVRLLNLVFVLCVFVEMVLVMDCWLMLLRFFIVRLYGVRRLGM